MADEKWTGGCQCGAVRYELLEKPGNPHLCHCRMCQKQFGNFFAALTGVPKAKFHITRGTLANFRSSEKVQRGFCRDCGTPLTYEPLERDNVSVSIGSLDRHADITPEYQYGIEAREPWFHTIGEIPAFITGEDETGSTDFALLLPDIEKTNRQHPDHETKEWPLK